VNQPNTHTRTNLRQKIQDRQLAAPTLSETLQDLVLNELKEKKHTATEGLVWLNRYALSTGSKDPVLTAFPVA